MNEMMVFSNPEFGEVRRVEIGGQFWLVAKDVTDILGYVNGRDALAKNVDDDEKINGVAVCDAMGRDQKMTVINESGVYSLIFSSKLPDAKKFKKWVTSEVLPSVRQTGTYSTQPPQLTPAQLIAAQAQVLVDMEQKMIAIQSQAQAIEAQQAELAQRVDTAIKVFSRPSEDHWKSDIDRAIKDMCEKRHLSDCATRGRMYRELEEKCCCNINTRLTRLRQRVKKKGMRHRDAMALNKLDAIAADKQLRAAFEGIVREWQARSAVVDGQQVIGEIQPVQEYFLEAFN